MKVLPLLCKPKNQTNQTWKFFCHHKRLFKIVACKCSFKTRGLSIRVLLHEKVPNWLKLHFFVYQCTVKPPWVTTSVKRPRIQITKIFPVKAFQLEPLVNGHLLKATATTFWA